MDQFVFEGKTVFKIGSGPTVILCHELAGMSQVCLDLAERIRRKGFSVVVPLLYGKPGQNSSVRGAIQLCLSREFRILSLNKASPISDWLRRLADSVAGSQATPGVAVIGMCATGGVVLGTLLSPSVRAVVASQPSLPAAPPIISTQRRRRSLGLPLREMERIKSGSKPVLAFRFKHDFICPKERLKSLDEEITAASVHQVPESGDYADVDPPISRLAHAVLTYDFSPRPGHPTQQAFEEVILFLKKNLSPQSEGGV